MSAPLGGPLRGRRQPRLSRLSRLRSRQEEGFTLVELMVVVLIIAILIAIAIPAFFAARQRAQNRTAQTDLRHALTAEKVYFTDNEAYTADSVALNEITATGAYAGDEPPTVPRTVYVAVLGDGAAVLGVRSVSGECFYMKDQPSGAAAGTTYGQEDPGGGACSAPSAAVVNASKWS